MNLSFQQVKKIWVIVNHKRINVSFFLDHEHFFFQLEMLSLESKFSKMKEFLKVKNPFQLFVGTRAEMSCIVLVKYKKAIALNIMLQVF